MKQCAAYQVGHIWGQALRPNPTLPSPSEWGWKKKNGIWISLWTTLAEASKECRELIKCNCKKRSQGRCKDALNYDSVVDNVWKKETNIFRHKLKTKMNHYSLCVCMDICTSKFQSQQNISTSCKVGVLYFRCYNCTLHSYNISSLKSVLIQK